MSITINTYCRVNQNGSININTDPRFGVPYSTNLTVQCGGNIDVDAQMVSVSIGGGPTYIIKEGSFPVYAALPDTFISAHHFGGTSITVTEAGNGTMTLSINGIEKEGTCVSPITGTYTYNYTFTENDIIIVSSSECGG
jgi:hypothetical protein